MQTSPPRAPLWLTAIAGGLDSELLRVLDWRFQADYVPSRLFAMPQNNVRFSTGIVLRW